MRIVAERYRLLRTHAGNDEILQRVVKGRRGAAQVGERRRLALRRVARDKRVVARLEAPRARTKPKRKRRPQGCVASTLVEVPVPASTRVPHRGRQLVLQLFVVGGLHLGPNLHRRDAARFHHPQRIHERESVRPLGVGRERERVLKLQKRNVRCASLRASCRRDRVQIPRTPRSSSVGGMRRGCRRISAASSCSMPRSA